MLTRYKLTFYNKIARWDEAVPLGNGRLGALIWGDSCKIRIALDYAALWDLRQSPHVGRPDFNARTLLRLIGEGEAGKAELDEKFCSFYEGYPYPTKLPTGSLELTTDNDRKCTFSLDLRTGVCTFVSGAYTFEAFAHQLEGIFVLSITGRQPAVTLIAPDFAGEKPVGKFEQSAHPEGLKILGYEKCRFVRDGACEYFIQPTYGGHSYCVMTATVSDGETTRIYAAVDSGKDGDLVVRLRARLQQLSEQPYNTFKERHHTYWREFWKACAVRLPDKRIQNLWNLYNYYLGSLFKPDCPPVALQGIWTADNGGLPPWKGDYHNDLNLQMTYWSYLKNNHVSQGEGLVQFLKNTEGKARAFAEQFYESKGLCLPGTCDLAGNPMGGWAQYSYSPANHSWLCFCLAQHYYYTGDTALLADFIYPYLKASAQTLLDFCDRDENGKYVIRCSSSPEIYGNDCKAWMTGNSNYDLALMRRHITDLADLAGILGNGEQSHWQKVLDDMPPFHKSRYGLMVDAKTEYFESHRHLGHAMAVYPLDLLDYDTDKRLIDDTLTRIESFGYTWWVGFSFPWMALLYTRARDGENALRHLNLYADNFISVNGFNLNGDYKRNGISCYTYRPFTLEGCFAYSAAVNEMLVQERGERILLLPAVPTAWRKKPLCFTGFRLLGGLIADFRSDGQTARLTLYNPFAACRRRIVYGGHTYDVTVVRGKTNLIVNDGERL